MRQLIATLLLVLMQATTVTGRFMEVVSAFNPV